MSSCQSLRSKLGGYADAGHGGVPHVARLRDQRSQASWTAIKNTLSAGFRNTPSPPNAFIARSRRKGFTGKYTIVKDFVREVRPKVGVPAVYRYETKPGVQSQVDWCECGRIEIDGKSRMRYVEFTLRIDVHTLIQCHLNAFRYFGGCTKEILYDNMKQIVFKRAPVSSGSTWNSQFEDFFNHYGFIPRLCRPYRPQTKGKIESNVSFVKRDFLLGSEFSSFPDLNSQAQKWLARVNSTIHGTTNET